MATRSCVPKVTWKGSGTTRAGIERVLAAPADRHARSLRDEGVGDDATDPAGAARDDRAESGESEVDPVIFATGPLRVRCGRFATLARVTTLLAHITVKPGSESTWEDLCRRLYAASHGSEPRLLRYEYWRGEAERSYYTLLSFEDHRAFIEHQTSDHHEDESPRIRDCVESIRLEFVDPVQDASPLPATDHQDAAEDASELARKYTEMYRARVADWWLDLR